MSIRLIETKSEYLKKDEREFLFKVSATEHILHYEELMLDDERLKEYLKDNPFPQDKYYTKEIFLSDLSSEGYISVICEKIETAEYVSNLIYELL